MGKKTASKEPPKAGNPAEDAPIEEEPSPICEDEVEEVEEAPPKTPEPFEQPVEAHLAALVIEMFGDADQDPLFTGERSVQYKGGHTYCGDFKDGKMSGQGEYVWTHGLRYKGDFIDNVISGAGTYQWVDGSVYEGEVLAGYRNGKGVFYCSSNPSVYDGDWVNGKRTGKGKIVYDCDEVSFYEGDWVDNKRSGYGYRRYPSGSTYDGDWFDNVRHGTGTMVWAGTGETYSGEWCMGVQQGQGLQHWAVDSNSQLPLKNEYDGQWLQGQRHGMGTFTYASGAKYEGEWVYNAKHGYGKFFFKDGSVFSGNFEKDSIVGRPGSPDMAKMMRSAVITGRVSSPLTPVNLSKTAQSSHFQLNIQHLITDEIHVEDEIDQVHNVLLRHISDLKKVYLLYCNIGGDDSGVLHRMEFWRFLKDCNLHTVITMPDADIVMSRSLDIECDVERHSPFTQFLFRQFLQSLVCLAAAVYGDQVQQENNGQGCYLAKCLRLLLENYVLCTTVYTSVGGYSHSSLLNKKYIQKCWEIYLHLTEKKKDNFTLRDILLVFKDLGLVGKHLSPGAVVGVIKNDNKHIDNEGALNMDVRINFYDFFDTLIGCIGCFKHTHESRPTTSIENETVRVVTDMSAYSLESPDKTPLPGSESPSKSMSKKNSPAETPMQSPAPSVDDRSDHNDAKASTPLPESICSDDLRHSVVLSPMADERCGSFDDWGMKLEDFFTCHFFPPAEKIIEIDMRLAAEKPASDAVSAA